jgi:anti-sigma factor RsiW
VNESEYQDLLETAARRALTAGEQARLEAWLAARPEARADWVMDERLTRCLRRLPDIPLPTNFTARVLHKAERLAEGHRPRHVPVWLRWLRGLGPGWHVAGALGAVALVVGVQYHQARQRADLSLSLQALPAASLAEVDLWRDFESINTLPAGPLPSVDQLAEAFK